MNGSVYPAGWVGARGICVQPKVLVCLPEGTVEAVRRASLTNTLHLGSLFGIAGEECFCPKDPVEYIYSDTGFQTV